MNSLRTPDSAFANIPDYPFEPHYHPIEPGISMHYVDEGSGLPVVMLHGEPSWSFLYRNMIPPLVAGGYRVIAPDLVGFGKSDKPTNPSDYTYANHIAWVESLFLALELESAVLFGQDWGGLIGLRLLANQIDRFSAFVVSNTGLPTGEHTIPDAFHDWLAHSQSRPVFPVGSVIQNGTVSKLSANVVAAYDAPFPDESYKVGARVFPSLVPISPTMDGAAENRRAWEKLMGFEGPCLTLFSDSDPMTAGGAKPFEKLVPGARGQPHRTIQQAGHFVQEDNPGALIDAMLPWLATIPA